MKSLALSLLTSIFKGRPVQCRQRGKKVVVVSFQTSSLFSISIFCMFCCLLWKFCFSLGLLIFASYFYKKFSKFVYSSSSKSLKMINLEKNLKSNKKNGCFFIIKRDKIISFEINFKKNHKISISTSKNLVRNPKVSVFT